MTVPHDPALTFETAGEHVTADVPVLAPTSTVSEAWASLGGQRFESVRDLAICDGPALVGLVRIEDLVASTGATRVVDIMDADPPVVGAGTDQEVAAWTMVDHGESSLAVVDDDEHFVGLVPPTRMLEVLLREHEEDLRRVGGFLHDTAQARLASGEPVLRRLGHRLPWLLIGLVGVLCSAVLVGGAEADLARNVELAFFIPGVVYLAGAVGTQTETLIVRGLSVGVPIRRIIGSELLTGVAIAVLLAATILPFAIVLSHHAPIGYTVSLAVLACCMTATLIGLGMPRALVALGQDPAFGSGPLVTIAQDLVSLAVYLGLARVLL